MELASFVLLSRFDGGVEIVATVVPITTASAAGLAVGGSHSQTVSELFAGEQFQAVVTLFSRNWPAMTA